MNAGITKQLLPLSMVLFLAPAMIPASHAQTEEQQAEEERTEEERTEEERTEEQESDSAQADDQQQQIEEVVVRGIRGSLDAALREKRSKANLTEIINAEDIGKLPDENVAEVLENIPGVQITRNAGIGAGVSVRGSNQNRIEINGRGTTPSSDGRGGISFSDLPSELVRSLNVVKVPTADLVEGSLGGTIDVKTYRGLSLKEPLRVFRPVSEYAGNSERWNENFSTTLGQKFTTDYGDVGAIITLSYSDKTVREDSLRVSPGVRRTTGNPPGRRSQLDFDGDGINDPYYRPGVGDQIYGLDEREIFSASSSFAWQASNSLQLFFEGTYVDYTDQGRRQSALIGLPDSDVELDGVDPENITEQFDFVSVAGTEVPILTSGVIGGGIRTNRRTDRPTDTASPNDGVRLRTSNRSSSRETQSYVAAFGGEWELDNAVLDFEFNAAGSKSEEPNFTLVYQFNNPDARNFHSIGAVMRVPFQYRLNGDIPEYGPVPGTVTDEQLLDPNYYSLFLARDQESFFDNKEFSQKANLTVALERDFWKSLKIGIRNSFRSINRRRDAQTTRNFPGFSAVDLAEFTTATPRDFFDFNSDGIYLENFLTGDPIAIAERRDELRSILGLDVGGLADPAQSFGVDEKTHALYARGDFEYSLFGIPFRGNAGVRAVRTNQRAFGNEVLADGSTRDVSETQKYTEYLPSASLVISPWEDVQFRLGYARLLRRPNFGALSPTVQFQLNANPVTVGNPNLEPTNADQFDLGLEYYFTKRSVFSIGLYHKKLDKVLGTQSVFNGICNPIGVDPNVGDPNLALPTCTTNGQDGILVQRISSVNLPGGTIQGFEVALQHHFRNLPSPFDGLGIIANYAYQDGDRDLSFRTPEFLRSEDNDQQFPLNFRQLSENSYNLTLYYEKYGFSGRIRYTFRDHFLVSESSDISNTLPLYQDDRGQLNASMSYDINDVFTVTLSGVNLTKEQRIQPGVFPEGPISRVFDSDRRIAIGLRARF